MTKDKNAGEQNVPSEKDIRTGREIAEFVKKNNNGKRTLPPGEKFFGMLSQSFIDKACTGRYSVRGLNTLKSFGFRPTIDAADKINGGYELRDWKEYIGEYVIVRMAIDLKDTIDAAHASIVWDDSTPGLVLYKKDKDGDVRLGNFRIRHIRSPIIIIQDADKIGSPIIIASTVIGKDIRMRGLYIGVENIAANAYVPMSTPVFIKKIINDDDKRNYKTGLFSNGTKQYKLYSKQLHEVIESGYCVVKLPLEIM